jgi:starch phosphorylase
MKLSAIDQLSERKEYQDLVDLALDLRSSWNHCADKVWRQLEPDLWDITRNPWAVLQSASQIRILEFINDKNFSVLVKKLAKERKKDLNSPGWFQKQYPKAPLKSIAYFSMEFMLSEALPIYSGGLGNVAGDQLKAASDLGVPVIGIGLLYSQGYFRQFIDKEGNQQEVYPYNDPGQLPIRPARLPNGEWLRIKINFPGWPFWLRTWEVKVGKTTLYLLDSNDIGNYPGLRGITSELYGGDHELRFLQELVLGLGGWRLLEALGVEPEICHMNEGHSAFAILERAFSFMQKTKQPFEVALAATRVGNIFTTHTAVSAGFDRFSCDLLKKYLGRYAETKLGISIERLIALGQLHPNDDFNMAYLAIRGSGYVNGVSQLHGTVSRHLFKDLFPRHPEEEIPIHYVTNGVHMPSWDSKESDDIWTEACGKERWHGKTEELEKKFRDVPDEKLWDLRNKSRSLLVEFARSRLVRQLETRGASKDDIEKAKSVLNANALTLGFARRFAGYKRPDLLLQDEDRLIRILTNPYHPVQLIIAGKAHPADSEGHALIQKWMKFIFRAEVRAQVVFLSDYDMLLTEQLVQGVDLWINTPRRPWEASGTSGMKVLVNGGLNLSELDGWWAEAYSPEVGWALGDHNGHSDDPNWDKKEANDLYELLEKEIISEFYNRNEKNIPVAWVRRIRESMARLTPHFSSNRTVREYAEKFYLPAAKLYNERAKNNGSLARKIVDWHGSLQENWDKIHFGDLKVKTLNDQHLFQVEVYLSGLDPQSIKVELYSQTLKTEMQYQGDKTASAPMHIYETQVPATIPISFFTPRIVPYFKECLIPLECNKILWQR